jgi:hypothetical protein
MAETPIASAENHLLARLKAKAAHNAANPPPLSPQSEALRVVRLPIAASLSKTDFDAFCVQEILGSAYNKGFRFFPPQAEAVLAYDNVPPGEKGGVFAPIAVGFGKTLVIIMIANRALRKPHIKRALLLLPPNTYRQFMERDLQWARHRVDVSMAVVGLQVDAISRRRIAHDPHYKGLYVMPYSLLSTRDTSDLLEHIKPDLIIADEAHNLKNHSAARTRRIMRVIEKRDPEVVALSGTMSAKSIMDFHHLIVACLREKAPVPIKPSLAKEWGVVLDATGVGDQAPEALRAQVERLVVWAQKAQAQGFIPATHNTEEYKKPILFDTSGMRRAFHLRLVTPVGVVATSDVDIGVSLSFVNDPAADAPHPTGHTMPQDGPRVPILAPFYKTLTTAQRLSYLMGCIEKEWLTPDGDEIDHAIHKFKWLNELTAGIYNRLFWPTPETIVKRRKVSQAEAESLLARSREHHGASQDYHKALRTWLKESARAGLDTPYLVGTSMARHKGEEVGADLYAWWARAKSMEFDGMIERESEPVRVHGYKIRKALDWSRKVLEETGKGGIVWVYHQAVGQWIFDVLKAAGVPTAHAPAGDEANKLLLDVKSGSETAKKIVVASMTAHGTGKNLQAFSNQFFAQWPRPAHIAEQVIGRTHRNGQEEDEIVVATCHTTEFDKQNFAACLRDAYFLHTTQGRQKLIYGRHDPIPEVYSDDLLREFGFRDMKKLDGTQEEELKERFGA